MGGTVNNDIRTAYDTVARSYATLLSDSSFEADPDLAMIEQFVQLLPGPRVLDAGCGAGRMMTHLLSLDSTLVVDGVDLSDGMVREARANHPSRRVVQGDLSRLPYTDCSFDGVLAWYSLIHTAPDDLAGQLAEVSRVLRPGGVALAAF